MAITVNINRQTRLVAYVDVTYADLTSGTSANAIHLPAGAMLLGGFVDITTAFSSSSSDVLDIGDTVASTPDDDKYSSSQITASSTGLTALTGTTATDSRIPAGGAWITATWTGAGTAATSGAFRLQVEYVVDDRVTEYHAYRG